MSESISTNGKATANKARHIRWFRWIMGSLAIVLVFPIILFFFVSLYKTEIIEVVNREISTRYNADIHFDDVDISLLKTFPRTSLVLKNLSLKNPLVADSVLLVAESVYLTVDVFSLFKKKVVIDGARVDESVMSYTHYKNGKSNWEIFTSDTTSSTVFIEDIVLSKCRVLYNHLGKKWVSNVTIDRADIRGDMMEPDGHFDIDMEFEFDSLMSAGNSYRPSVSIRIEGNDVARKGNAFQCKDFECTTGEVLWKADLDLHLEEKNTTRIILETTETPLDEILAVLPGKYLQDLSGYSLGGESDLKLEVNIGPNDKSLQGVFQLRDGKCVYKDAGELKKLYADIEFGTDDGGYCEIKKCLAATENGKLAIDGRLNFAKEGYFSGSIQYEGPLGELSAMSAINNEYNISGDASIQTQLVGVLFDKNAKLQPQMRDGNGWLRIHNARAFIPALNATAEQLQLDAEVNTSNLKIKTLQFLLNGSQFNVEGNIINPLGISQERSLRMNDLVIQSGPINLQNWSFQQQSSGAATTIDESSEVKYSLNGTFHCSNIHLDAIDLKDFNCDFGLTTEEIQLDEITAGIANGQITGSYHQHGKDFGGHFSFGNLDIQQLFLQTNNFGQSKITSQNISGKLTGSTTVNAAWAPDGGISKKTLWMESDITIHNGRLRNYTPLIQLVDFIEQNKMLSVFTNEAELREKLSDVEFKDLSNTLFVQEGQIIIPEMKIESSAFDISAKGSQTFDGVIDYNIGFNIFEVLRNKEKTSARGRNNIFIHMFGTTETPQFEVEKELIKLPDILLPSFLEERRDDVRDINPNNTATESGGSDTTKHKNKLPSLIKNKEGQTRKWLREKN